MNPKKTKMESPSSPDDVLLHDDGAAEEGCIKTDVRRSLKGLRNEAPSLEDEAIMLLQARSIKLNVRSQSKEVKKLGNGKKALESSCEMKFFSSCWPWSYVIRVLMISNYKSQIQQKKLFCCHPAILLQMPAKSKPDCKFKLRITNYKLQLRRFLVTNHKLQRKKELTKS